MRLPASTVALGKSRWRPAIVFLKLSRNSKLPSRSSSTATSAGAPTFSVPRSLNRGNMREGLTVARAIASIDRHAVAEQLRHAVGKVDDAGLTAVRAPVGRERIRPEAGLHDRADGVPSHMSGLAVADVEPDAAAPRGKHFWQNVAAVIDDAVGRRREHVGDDVAALQEIEQLGEAATSSVPCGS